MDCPDWICNVQNIPHDYVYFLTGVFISIPYLLFILWLYRTRIVNFSKTNKYFSFLTMPIGAAIYFSIIFYSFPPIPSRILSFIGVVAYVPAFFMIMLSYLSVIGIIILMFVTLFKKWKKKNN